MGKGRAGIIRDAPNATNQECEYRENRWRGVVRRQGVGEIVYVGLQQRKLAGKYVDEDGDAPSKVSSD